MTKMYPGGNSCGHGHKGRNAKARRGPSELRGAALPAAHERKPTAPPAPGRALQYPIILHAAPCSAKAKAKASLQPKTVQLKGCKPRA